MKEAGIYIHIPFCDHKCIYCDFYSIIKFDGVKAFFSSIKEEIMHYSVKYGNEREYRTIFFGGGTPSLSEPSDLAELINLIKQNFNLIPNAEITMETNPGTVDLSKLSNFKHAGINRVSIGIQSFDEADLKFLTRIHDKKGAIQTVFNAVEAGFENINIDLIFNLPGQSSEKWSKNLEIAGNLPVNHISAYSLILERGTILNKMVLNGEVSIQDEDFDAGLYEQSMQFFRGKGFNQYEVSNYCMPGYECKHNQIYWDCKEYLGFGPSAHSFYNGKRWWNISSLSGYLKAIQKNGGIAIAGEEMLTDEQFTEEYIMLGLRSRGIKIGKISALIAGKRALIDRLIGSGHLIMEGEFIKLTEKGFPVCDEIVTELIS